MKNDEHKKTLYFFLDYADSIILYNSPRKEFDKILILQVKSKHDGELFTATHHVTRTLESFFACYDMLSMIEGLTEIVTYLGGECVMRYSKEAKRLIKVAKSAEA